MALLLQLRRLGLALLAWWAARPAPAAAAALDVRGDWGSNFMLVRGNVSVLPAGALGPCFPYDSVILGNRSVNQKVQLKDWPLPCLLTRLRYGGGTPNPMQAPGDKAVFVPWIGQLAAWSQFGEDLVGHVHGIACLLQAEDGNMQACALEFRALVAGNVTLALEAPIWDDQGKDLRQVFGSTSWAETAVSPIGVDSIFQSLVELSASLDDGSADPTVKTVAGWLREYLAKLHEMVVDGLTAQAEYVRVRMRRHMRELLAMATPKVKANVYLPVIFVSLLIPLWAVGWLGWGVPKLPTESPKESRSSSSVGEPVRIILPVAAQDKASPEPVSVRYSLKVCMCDVWCCGTCPLGFCHVRPPRDNLYAKASTPWAHAAINMLSSHVRIPALNAIVIAMICLQMYKVIMKGQLKDEVNVAFGKVLPWWLQSAVLYLIYLLFSQVFVQIATIGTLGNNIYHSHCFLLTTGLCATGALLQGPTGAGAGSFFSLPDEMDLHNFMRHVVKRMMAMSMLVLCVRASFSRVTFHDEVVARSALYVRERLRRTSDSSRMRRSPAKVWAPVSVSSGSSTVRGDAPGAKKEAAGSWPGKLVRSLSRPLGKAILAASGGSLESVNEEHPLPPIFMPPILITAILLSVCMVVPVMALAVTEIARFRWIVRALMRGDIATMVHDEEPAKLVGALGESAAEFLRSPAVQQMVQQPVVAFQVVVSWLPIPEAVEQFLGRLAMSIVPTQFDGRSESDALREHERLKKRLEVVADLLLASSTLACAMALIAVIWLLYTAVNSFRREYVACLRGRWAKLHPGVMQGRKDQKWKATLVPGMMISLCFFAFFFILFDIVVLGLAVGVAIIDGTLVWRLFLMGTPVAVMFATQYIVMKKCLFETYFLDNRGAVKRPAAFVFAFSTFIISNMASGIFEGIWRIGALFVSLLMHSAFRVDISTFQEKGTDRVFVSFLSLVQITAAFHNPIMQTFCHIVSPRVDDTWQPAPAPGRGVGDAPALQDLLGPAVRSAEDFLAACSPDDRGKVILFRFERAVREQNPEVSSKLVAAVFKLLEEGSSGAADAAVVRAAVERAVMERQSHERRVRVRNRFWLLLTLHRNPDLVVDRRHRLEEDASTGACGPELAGGEGSLGSTPKRGPESASEAGSFGSTPKWYPGTAHRRLHHEFEAPADALP